MIYAPILMVFAFAALSGMGSLIAGSIRDASGSYDVAFLSLIAALVPAAWCFLTLPKIIALPVQSAARAAWIMAGMWASPPLP